MTLKRSAPYILFVLLAILILGKGLLPGHLFLLDMPWPQEFRISAYTQNGLPPHTAILALLHVIGIAVPGWILQKMVLFSVLFAAAAGVYQLAIWILKNTPIRGLSGQNNPVFLATASGGLALLNPYVLERLLAGQWLVVAGFAYTPFVILALVKSLHEPTKKHALIFALLYVTFPMASLHWWYAVTPVLALITFFHQLYSSRRLPAIRVIAGAAGIASILLIANSFWLGSIAGDGGRLSTIGSQDFEVFQTVDQTGFGREISVISQHGFWRGLSVLPTPSTVHVVSGLVLFAAALVGLALLAHRRSATALAFAVSMPFVIILALGYGHPVGQSAIEAGLHIPGFAGLRETAKLIGLITLPVALCAPIGISFLVKKRLAGRATAVLVVVISAGIYLPATLSNDRLTTHDYPLAYANARSILHDIDQPTIVVPWTRYLKLNFADNQFVANPATVYFDTQLRLSAASGNRLLDTNLDEFEHSVQRPYSSEWAATIKSAGYSYVLIQKTDAWQNYQTLLENHTVIYDSAEIAIVRVN